MATYLATNDFPGDGSTTLRNVNFKGNRPDAESGTVPYLDPANVKAKQITPATETTPEVEVDLTCTYVGPNQFNCTPASPVGTIVRVYRDTQDEYPLVDYQALQNVGEADLDLANKQAVFIVQEARDLATLAGVDADNAVTVAYDAKTTADEATATANDAVDIANAATAAANHAVAVSAAAEVVANAAAVTADNAYTLASGVAGDATAALNAANAAVVTANAASATANAIAGTANSALSSANAAVTTANAASATANAIAGTANTALTNANAAVSTANDAIAIANGANSTANAVDGKAQTALDNSVEALDTANDAAADVTALTTVVNGKIDAVVDAAAASSTSLVKGEVANVVTIKSLKIGTGLNLTGTSDYVSIDAAALDARVTTLETQRRSGSAQVTMSGSTLTVTGIPSWATKVELDVNAASTTVLAIPLVQLRAGGALVQVYDTICTQLGVSAMSSVRSATATAVSVGTTTSQFPIAGSFSLHFEAENTAIAGSGNTIWHVHGQANTSATTQSLFNAQATVTGTAVDGITISVPGSSFDDGVLTVHWSN